MWGIDFIHNAAGILMLAAGPGALTCTVPEAPRVIITPRTADIKYDFSKSEAELTAMAREKGTTPNAARHDVNTHVGGLRHDRPQTNTNVTVKGMTETWNDKPTRVCLWYGTVELVIDLRPVIYLAREKNVPGACREEILEHERRHVQVDREVMNKFARDVGAAIQREVDMAGAQGPYPAVNTEAVRSRMADRIHKLVDAHTAAMTRTMDARQALVDSPEEYKRISDICNARPTAQEKPTRGPRAAYRHRPVGR
jgi:hypothetical protein